MDKQQLLEATGLSWEEIGRRVCAAVNRRYPSNDMAPGGWPVATYPDRVIVTADGKTWEHAYTMTDGEVTLGDRVEVVPTFTRVTESCLIEAVKGTEGREWDVILITEGASKNRGKLPGTGQRYYPADALAAAAPLFEGAAAYADHATEPRKGRSVTDKVGVFREAVYGEHETRGGKVKGIKARFKVMSKALRETLLEAHDAGEPDFLGFSIDALGKVSRKEHGGQVYEWVDAITKVNSVDVVTDPAAGGQVVRLVASADAEGDDMLTKEEIAVVVQEQVAASVAAAVATALKEHATPTPSEDKADTVNVQEQIDASVAKQVRQATAPLRIDGALNATNLSEPGKAVVRRTLLHMVESRELTDDELQQVITEQVNYEASFVQALPTTMRRVTIGDDGRRKMYHALDGWFRGEDVEGIKRFRTLKEAYCRWEGKDVFDDFNVLEMLQAFGGKYDAGITHTKLQESLATADWAQVFADVMHYNLIRLYRGNPDYGNWQKLVSDVEDVPDFETRHWVRTGGYGDLPAVLEGGTYTQATSPGDEEVSYAISKRGFLDDFTIETLTGERANAVRSLPQKMANAALRTLYKFVMNLATTTNPTMDYDSVALYDAAHSNTGTTALSVSGLDAVAVAMRSQTAFGESSEILGSRNKPRYIIVPNELESRALRILNPSDGYTFALSSNPDTDTNMDPARWKGQGIEALVYDQLTDGTDWFVVADPAQVPTIVMGFLNGQREPELFVQDQPNVGSAFTADKVTYKIRHIYGGDVLDHRSFYRQVVTGS